MPFPGEPKPWHKPLNRQEIENVAKQIAESVRALAGRMVMTDCDATRNLTAEIKKEARRITRSGGSLTRRSGTANYEAAYNPDDPESNKAFERLWDVSFNQHYTPDDQTRILTELRLRHPGTVETMRHISQASERVMELGHARRAIEAARSIKDTSLIEEWNRLCQEGYKQSRLYETALAVHDDAKARAAKKALDKLMPHYDTLLKNRKALLDHITQSFPYGTYELLASTEEVSLTGLCGLTPERMFQESHLFIDAGPLPLTAIYHIMKRHFGHVVCTESDPDSYKTATEFVKQLERLGVLEPGHVFVVQADPLHPEFAEAVRSAAAIRPFHSATISQLVQGRDNVEKIATMLVDKSAKGADIDTIIVRGADGLVEMLYEPMNNLILPNGVRKRITNVPVHAEPHSTGDHDFNKDLHHTFLCYNTSHVYSAHQRKKNFDPGEENTLFRGKAMDEYMRRS